MRTLLALVLVVAVSAHWTHDESLAQEIGPPPGDEDVASLSDADLGESVGDTDKTYRVTIGTRAHGMTNAMNNGPDKSGGSFSKFKISMKGPTDNAFVGDKDVRYYQGPIMTYANAADAAPAFRFGMAPFIDKNGACSGTEKATHLSKYCSAGHINAMDPCEPNGKACLSAIESGSVGYGFGQTTKLYSDEHDKSKFIETGIIQRGQVKFKDIGQIVEVKIREDVSWGAENKCYDGGARNKRECSSPWAPAFVKVSTNNPQTGIGNGVYYIEPRSDLYVGVIGIKGSNNQEEDKAEELIAKPRDPTTQSGLPEDDSFNAILTKCVAEHCEEEMESKLRIAEMTADFEETK